MQLGFGDICIFPKVDQNATLERLSSEVTCYRLEKPPGAADAGGGAGAV
jgi:hypothetical protein